MAHTKGPWRFDRRSYSSHSHYVTQDWKRVEEKDRLHGSAGAIAKLPPSMFHDVEANARLISAAPELLEALKAFSLYYLSGNSTPVERATIKADSEAVRLMHAAIAKAEGK